jgi:hypothetical protein
MKEVEIIEAVQGWFRREYGAGAYCGECRLRSGRRADLIYVSRADSIHAVEAKSTASDWSPAFRQLRDYPANYKWLALPKEEYLSFGTFISSECSERGYGLFLVSGTGNRHIVEPRRQAEYKSGRFDSSWPSAFCG